VSDGWYHRLLFLGLLATLIGRSALTYRVFNDTFDESIHLRAGLEILQRGSYTIETLHPPLARLVIAAPPYFLAGLRLNEHNHLWHGGAWDRDELSYYWKTLALARAGSLIFAVLLLFFVYRWTLELYGPRAAAVACLLAVCCPNLIAHASLATTDMAGAAATLMTAYFFWRWSHHPGLRYCLASAAGFTLAVLCKFSALFYLPPLGLLYFLMARWSSWRWDGRIRRAIGWKSLRAASAFSLIFLLGVWAAYLFDVGTIVPPGHGYVGPAPLGPEPSLPQFLLKAVGDKRLPAYRFALGVIDLLTFNEAGHRAYLLGRFSQHGWWYYFPAAVVLKSTLPLLLLVGMALVLYASRRYAGGPRNTSYVVLATALVLGLSMLTNVNLGVRYVLLVFPLFAILSGGIFAAADRLVARQRVLQVVGWCLVAWHAGESVAAHPDYLGYFNQIASGREERFLLDSNLDWGQDLARLGRFVEENRIESIRLSYFGLTKPNRMGIAATKLSPHQPESGWAAISINNLKGLVGNPADFEWLRNQSPVARVGKSIWIYYRENGSGPR